MGSWMGWMGRLGSPSMLHTAPTSLAAIAKGGLFNGGTRPRPLLPYVTPWSIFSGDSSDASAIAAYTAAVNTYMAIHGHK
ncbi:hypothetical protein K458DRAFT_392848 [Lentithecium fluviatile CBS 122367]|uniref:Uncharacterized protein n=1 Tax=Lentithecium fluviatile CBS 122367 TaxID=1168545 RepID=A0A6G1IQX7_9PLEO|nr:hypothetical protein K458DRAFT_392848 [Lentithecium fluviatile CBS 122367]